MRLFDKASAGSRLRGAMTLAILVLVSAALAACASSGEGGSSGGFMNTLWKGGNDNKPDDITADYFTQSTYCPRIEIRGGTEALAFYEKGHDGDPAFVKYQASIGKTARECHNSGPNYNLKIGVTGRVVAGPKGVSGSITVPLRVAVTRQFEAPVYSELFKIPVNLAAPDFASDFAHVIEQIALQIGPDQHNFIIYVGFDDGKAKPAPKNLPTG